MDLWIRSQDKKRLGDICVVPEYAKIKTGKKITNILGATFDEEVYEVIGYKITKNDVVLGFYKTEERALEVLDEIQRLLTINVNIINESYERADLILKSDILCNMMKIYEMPEDR